MMAAKSVVLHGLVVLTVVACLSIVGCGKKGHCAKCSNDSECDSGFCTVFITDSGNQSLLCGNGNRNDTCNVPR